MTMKSRIRPGCRLWVGNLSVLRGVEDDGGLSFSNGDTLPYCDYRETGAAIEDACCWKATVAALNPTTKPGALEEPRSKLSKRISRLQFQAWIHRLSLLSIHHRDANWQSIYSTHHFCFHRRFVLIVCFWQWFRNVLGAHGFMKSSLSCHTCGSAGLKWTSS